MPDDTDEAWRDLVRAREDAVGVGTQAKYRLKAFLLRQLAPRGDGRPSATRSKRCAACCSSRRAAWAYQGIPRVGRQHAYRQEAWPKVVCDIAWKAPLRLTTRFRKLVARGKAKPKVATAIARELSGCVWAIAREVAPTPR